MYLLEILENEELIRRIEAIAAVTIQNKLKDPSSNFNDIKSAIASDLFPFIYEVTGRKPIILPVILDIKRN